MKFRFKFKLKPFFKDIFLTSITQAIILIAFFFIYRLIAKNFGPEGVGEYSLVKRVVGFLQPFLFLGLSAGIPRYIAISSTEEKKNSYVKAGGLVVVIFTFVFLIFINIFKELFAEIFFGTIEYINLVLPFSFFLAGLTLHSLVYSYFRGYLLIKTFNFLQLINLTLVPIGVLVIFRGITIDKLITLIGIIAFAIALIFLLFSINNFFINIERLQFKDSLKKLLHYSLPRVPGDLALAGLLSLGPILAIHIASIREVGYLSISQSLLSIAGTAIAPLGLIILPRVSSLIINGGEKIIKDNLSFLIGAILQLSIFISLQFIIFADVIIKYWLGPEFSEAVIVIRIIFFSGVFYIFYLAIRSIIDAVEIRPLNAINTFISLGVFLFLVAILLFLFKTFTPIINLSVATASGLICLGILTYISIRKIYPEKTKKDFNYLWIAVTLSVLLGSVAILIKPFAVSNLYYLIGFIMSINIIYLLILWLLRMEWIRQVFRGIF